MDNQTIATFAAQYNLEMVHSPDPALPNEVSWTYTFRLNPGKNKEMTTIRMAQIINENEPFLVKLAEPNLYSVKPLDCETTSEMGLSPGGTDGTWYIDNTGGVI